LPATTRHLALTIAQFFKPSALEAWPSRTTLAKKTGRSLGTIDDHTKALEKAGYLRVERTRGGALTPHRYYGVFPPTAQLAPDFSTTTQLGEKNDPVEPENGSVAAPEEVRKRRRRRSDGRSRPISDCWGCKQQRPLVDDDVLYCADCWRALEEGC
jgi:Helix-turn-helix domain